jgi:hypothetical protein
MGKKVLTSLTSLLRHAQRRANVAQNASTGMFDKKTTPVPTAKPKQLTEARRHYN